MNKKTTLLTTFLALGLALTGCGKTPAQTTSNSDSNTNPTTATPTPTTASSTSSDSGDLNRIEGNGTDWVDSIQALLDQAYAAIGDESIALPYVDAKYYYAEFAHLGYAENNNYEVSGTTIIAFDSEDVTVDDAKRENFMKSYKEHYSNLGFDVDTTGYSKNRTWIASKVIHGNKMMFVQFGLQILKTLEDYTPIYGLIISVGVQQYISANGYVGDYLDAWPTEGFKEVVGTDILHPTYENESAVTYFGGFNVFPGTDGQGNQILLDIYVLNCIGATENDFANYKKALEAAGYEMLVDKDTKEVYGAYDFVTGVVLEFAYSTQKDYTGIVIFAYQGSEPFTKTDELPSFASSLPAYVEADKTFDYYYSTRTVRTNNGNVTLHTILIVGVSDNACEAYKAILEANGFQVGTDENDSSYYLASNSDLNVYLEFYLATFSVGQCLVIGLFEF